jgi:hypothetical protein
MIRMPDLCAPTRGVRHDMDSAVASLVRMGVEIDQIVIRSAGPGWPAGTVVEQSPAPGEAIGPGPVVLAVAEKGGVQGLPYPLRDARDGEFGVDALFALFDNPVHKLVHHLRQAGQLLALRPDDPGSARRWIEDIFGIDPSPWPRERWYALARVLPSLHRVAGRADAVPLAFRVVFGLPVQGVRTVPGIVPLAASRQTRVGQANSRLGVDTVAGTGALGVRRLEVTFGPLELDEYRAHALSDALRGEREALYRLVVPAHLSAQVQERWVVGDPANPPRLGDPRQAAMLGVNARLGEP